MKLLRNHRSEPGNQLLVPFLNLLFLLTAFLLLLTRFVGQPGFAVSLPASPFLAAPEQNPLGVNLTASPVPALFFNDLRMSPEEFGRALREIPAPRRTIVIRADRRVPFELVSEVSGICMQHGFPVILATARE